MTLDLTAIQTALKAGNCSLPPLPESAQAILGGELTQPQLWIIDRVQGLEKLADSFRTLSKNTEKEVYIFQGLENNDMGIVGESL